MQPPEQIGSFTPLSATSARGNTPQSSSPPKTLLIIFLLMTLVLVILVTVYVATMNKTNTGAKQPTVGTVSQTIGQTAVSPTVPQPSTVSSVESQLKSLDVSSPEGAIAPLNNDVKGL